MRFKVKLALSGGGNRELELEDCSSVQDAIEQAKSTYNNCVIKSVDLLPKAGYVRAYSDGEQIEVPVDSIYIPF